jgi:antitoxin PrlF
MWSNMYIGRAGTTDMATQDAPEETTVSDRGMVTIPADIRRQLDIGPGDKLRWDVDEEGNLTVAVIRQREGVFDDFEPVDAGETNAVEAEREFGAE